MMADWANGSHVGLLPFFSRTRIRHTYKLEGNVGVDCIESFCCCCCVVIQNEREVRGREEIVRRNEGPVGAGTQYQSVGPGAMVYAPGGG